jgi:hypothetical protein
MGQLTSERPSNDARTLLFSHRNLYEPEAWRAGYRELETVIAEVDAVDVVAPRRGKWYRQRKRNALRVGKYTPIVLNPGVEKVSLKKDYDLLFSVCEKPSDLLNVNAIKDWRDHCRKAICWMTEFYERDIPQYKSVLRTLSHFDLVLFSTVGTSAFKSLLGNRVAYLPPGIDSIKFCPYPETPYRFIDVLSIGRRAEETHKSLFRMSQSEGILYMYDTIKDLAVYDVEEHRFLFANLAKRSRYFIVNPGKVDRSVETGGQSEFGPRYFEGLAAGAILLGERPKNNAEFDKIFHWPEAVFHVPYGSGHIREVIHELNKDPFRQERIRSRNITESLAKHDWVYRWEVVLNLAGLQPLAKLVERKKRLADLMKAQAGQPIFSGAQVS